MSDAIIKRYFETGRIDGLPNGMFIGGQFVKALSGNEIPCHDPGTGEVFASAPAGEAEDVERAIESARRGLALWRNVKPAERCRVLNRMAVLLRERTDYLAVIETLDSGKGIAESRGDFASAARLFEYYAGMADKIEGRSIPLGPDQTSFTIREPAGIVAQIIPWNYPTSTFARGIAPALAAGCAVIAKPAETTPFTALLMAGLLKEAGLPDDVLNVVTGYGTTAGAALVAHPEVRHITFTGSVATGTRVMQAAAQNITQLTLELGGKSPLVALGDADAERVAEGALWAIYSNAGQVCSAGSRLVIEKSLHNQVMERLVAKTEALTIGHGLDNPDMAAIHSALQLEKVSGHVERARARGASIVTGGRVLTDPKRGKGWFYAPTIIDALAVDDPLVQEEIFGPVLSVQVVEDAEEAIAKANATDFALMAGIYTNNIGRALAIARSLDSGQVTINDYWAGGIEVPFGGNRKSGFGREKGQEGIDAYLRTKAITIRH